MLTARPPEGFRVDVSKKARAALAANRRAYKGLNFTFEALVAHLRLVKMRVGVPVDPDFPHRRTFVSKGHAPTSSPTVVVAYTCLGDRLEIIDLLISAP